MAKKIGLRIANNVDITKVFSANLLSAGGRGIDHETMALETHSNDVCPTIRTITNFVLICEPMKEETNKEPKICAMRGRDKDNPSIRGKSNENYEQRLEINENGVSNTITTVSKDNLVAEPIIIANTDGFGQCYESKDVSPTVKSSAFQYNNALIEPIEQEVLGWVRDSKGNVIKRPTVDVANTVTAGKRDNTQNCVKEKIVLHEDVNGEFTTFTNYTPTLPFRVRRLTERELFRLMDVSEEDIDKIQAAGISKTQQAKMAGNSICVNVLYHIFRKLYVDTDEENEQLSLF